ncbi:hypothetical protein COY05_00175 [Candidatus Peregrinibacteria bacterium CG_4_10_14_0_2_um_filter_38_24]|nr:MAG: hypothetical protein COY05_00175 [Candidatus Peregrinibacteria bacterium CG_4_10_14_0_2_um_filter_38_24]PJC39145.1 MAG: hypothetical protein CO044_01300 [Candidatus Peregrinibacteria bacterium CG_4_9_14_0_2_um_filter_38_9]
MRHLRIFSKGHLVRMYVVDFLKFTISPVTYLLNNPASEKVFSFLEGIKNYISSVIPVAPQKRLLFQASVVSIVALAMTSITAGGNFTAASMMYQESYMESYITPGDVLVSDENGYIVKMNPITDSSSRVGLSDYAVHVVESGESLSVIAARYGLKSETIMWENHLANANSLRIGQSLRVPPVDGVSYTVKSGDTLDKIAKKYSISQDVIVAQNGLSTETLAKGQSVFLPNAKPINGDLIAGSTYRVSSVTRDIRAISAAPSNAAPAVGKIFIFPTRGKITQGYHSGHYAIDIADRSKPPIWSAASGTVIKASSGTWGGGYGNHVIIDNGDGVQTLYAHMDSVSVSVGQHVNQGEVIGIMGNTGRVYGITGIHLHWEVMINGVKKNPINYY